MLNEKWTCRACGKENPAFAWVCKCAKNESSCINHPEEKGIHKTPDGMLCVTCFDHFDKDTDDENRRSEYEAD